MNACEKVGRSRRRTGWLLTRSREVVASMPKSRGRGGRRHGRAKHTQSPGGDRTGILARPSGVPVPENDLHFPIFALKRDADGAQTTSPVIYGTAFPIAPGVFLSAGHVLRDASADGVPVLSRIPSPSGPRLFQPFRLQFNIFTGIDLAVLKCEGLADIVPLPLDFDRTLTIGDEVSALGFPVAVDAEWVSVVHRGFRGHVITRREFYHLNGQPPGYELSFPAPRGLSGAPLVSRITGYHECYGYVVQQGTLGTAGEPTPVALAVDIKAILSVPALAQLFGRPVWDIVRTPPQRPGGFDLPQGLDEDWPD